MHELPCTLSVSISLLFFHFRKILPSAILQVPFFPFSPLHIPVLPLLPLLRAANFSQSHPRFPLLQPSVVASLNVSLLSRHISLCPSSEPNMLFGHKLLFLELLCVAMRDIQLQLPCRSAVIFGRIEQHVSVLGKCYPDFLLPRHHSTPLLFSASVSRVCAFRVHGYLECTLCPEALWTIVCRDIFVYAGKSDNSIRYTL